MTAENNSLNPLSRGISEGIALFTACRNRSANLEKALRTWITHEEVDEIIVLDWSSDESLKPLIDKYQNGKIILTEVPGQKRWVLSHAYNLAARLTTRTRIFKIDSDVEITGDFFRKHKLAQGKFFSGNWRKARDMNERHLNGMVYLMRNDFFKVNGYNEFIKKYGWDDCNFYERLEASGLKKKDFDLDTLHHIEHKRRVTADPASRALTVSDKAAALLNIITNMAACETFPNWQKREMMKFDVRIIGENHLSCEQHGEDENIVSEEIMLQAEESALRKVLADGNEDGLAFSQSMTHSLNREELSRLYGIINALPTEKENRNGFVLVTTAGHDREMSGILEALTFLHTHYHHPAISEMVVFYAGHSGYMIYKYLSGKDRVRIIMSDAEPSIEELLHYARVNLAANKVIISNAPTDFDDILQRLAGINFDNGLFSLVRWITPERNSKTAPVRSGTAERIKRLLGILRKGRS